MAQALLLPSDAHVPGLPAHNLVPPSPPRRTAFRTSGFFVVAAPPDSYKTQLLANIAEENARAGAQR